MKYLEKYAFEFIPDITEWVDFPKEPTDDNINKLHKKEYPFSFRNMHTNNI